MKKYLVKIAYLNFLGTMNYINFETAAKNKKEALKNAIITYNLHNEEYQAKVKERKEFPSGAYTLEKDKRGKIKKVDFLEKLLSL